MSSELHTRVRELAAERNAVILAHNYQIGEVQDVADYVGDSLGLAQEAARTDADVIVFAGVHFMAETAYILSPEKTVLLPDSRAGCPMADMITAEQLRGFKAEHPGVPVVTYVNSSAEVKAESDYCCTSANAVAIVEAVPGDAVLFVPDRYLGSYVAARTKKTVTTWRGYCPTHAWLTREDIDRLRTEYPEAEIIVHPECRQEVAEAADFALSTGGMIRRAGESPASTIIIGTEEGILHRLRKLYPEKQFVLASKKLLCPNMKRTTLEKILWSLEDMTGVVTVPADIAERARISIERMLEISARPAAATG